MWRASLPQGLWLELPRASGQGIVTLWAGAGMLPVGVLDEYIKRCPAAVMGRATVERLFQPERWEEIFERHSASVATCRRKSSPS